jgi:hypothetical protein
VTDSYGVHIEPVARACLGEPNKALSSATELRFGTHGSMSVDLGAGTFYDHEAKVGGGVLDLLCRAGFANDHGAAAKILKEEFGAELPDDRRQEPKREPAKIVATYDYVDEHGEVLFQVCRYEPKTFRQRRPDGSGWSWSVKGVRPLPYRLPELLKAGKARVVFIAEGEKDVDNLAALGVLATCNAGGAGKWPADLTEFFAGRDVVILRDNDDAGHKHGDLVAGLLYGTAKRVRVLDLPGLKAKGDPTDWIADGGTKAQLVALAVQAPEYQRDTAHPVSTLGAIHWSDLDHVEVRADWLAQDLMFCGDTGMFYGASGSGKSFLAVDMGLAIARGSMFLGKRTLQGGVIYQAGEGGKGLVKRLVAYRQHHNLYAVQLPFVLLPEAVDMFGDGEAVQAFIAECLTQAAAMPCPLRAIFIDTFSTASLGANENDSADMGRMLKAGEMIAKATGAALIWVHHKNAAGDRERGHTSLRANIDTAMEVVRDEGSNRRTVRLAKLKDGEDGITLAFELQPVTIGEDAHGVPITSCVIAPAAAPVSTRAKARLSAGQARYMRALEQAIARRGGLIPPGDGVPDRQVGVAWQAFRDIYWAANSTGKEPGTVRAALSRDGDLLVDMKLIGRRDDWLWLTERGELWL